MTTQNKISWLDFLALIVWALPPIYLISTYPSLPSNMPLHFDINGNPDRIGAKQDFLLTILIIAAIGLGVALLVRFVPQIDPRKKAQFSPTIFVRVSQAILFLFAIITGAVVYTGTSGHFSLRRNLVFPAIALFFSVLGNLMADIRPNYFVGVRTPWTLENEEVWKKTHRLTAKLWQPAGVVLAILTFFLSGKAVIIVFIAGIFLIALIPVIYSYICYRRLPK